MSLVLLEDGDSRAATIVRRGKKATSTMTKSFKLFGTADDTAVHTYLNGVISGSSWQYPGVPGMVLKPESYSVSFLGDNAWQVSVVYEKDGANEEGEPLKRARSFDTTGGTRHMTQADNERRYPSTSPDQQKAIGVDANGVNGVDVVTPALQWQETYDVPDSYVTSAWIRSVAGITGTTNNAAFRGFEAGEVLFVGCSGSHEWDDQKGRGPWSLSFKFIASQNVTNQPIGSITGIEKKGHEYLWVRYEDSVASNTLLKTPKAVYVNRVYKESSFSALGIGTT